MLKINNVSKIFGRKTVLNNISLTVKSGEIAAFVGPSGVGKSTLLRILNNLERIDSGSITLNGTPLDLTLVNTAHTVGMVFQQFNLFDHLTATQNITLPLEKTAGLTAAHAQQRAHELLTRYELSEKSNAYPHQLSGGQKQRLAIARAIALKPSIVCFDEPTSALDPLLTSHVAQNIQELAREGYIVLLATHDTTLLEKLDCTIYLMSAGTILETVSSSSFYHNRATYPQIDKFLAGIISDVQNSPD